MTSHSNRVLLVDDDPDLLDVFTFYLEEVGFEVTSALGGKAAGAIFREGSFSVVISDQQMPEGSGLELLDEVKSLKPDQAFGLFFSEVDQLKLAQAYARGADYLLAKPIDAEGLTAATRFLELSLADRWSSKGKSQSKVHPAHSPHTVVTEAGEEQLGRGGLFLQVEAHDTSWAASGSILSFKVEIRGSKSLVLEGEAIVRWVLPGPAQFSQRILGLEFISMSPASCIAVLDLIQRRNPRCHIPCPLLTKRD